MRGDAGSLAWLIVLLVAFALGAASGSYVAGRPAATAPSPTPQTVVVRTATLSRTLPSLATAEWPTLRRLYAPTSGIITEAAASPGVLHAGDVLIRVDERPIVVVPGEIAAYRPLELGARGRDVASLQRYLRGAGFVVDDDLERFTSVTAAAVREWQRSLGLPPTGSVALGDVLFVPPSVLGAPTRWVGEVAVGAPVAAGAPIIELLADQPVLTIDFGSTAPAEFVPGLRGEAAFANGGRRGVVLAAIETTGGRVTGRVGPADGLLCRVDDCLDLVPVEGATGVPVDWIIVPPTSGPVVPVAALQSDAGGGAFVLLPDGSRRPVTVRVVSGGQAVIDGVEAGETILLP